MELIGEKEQNQNENVIAKLDKVLGDIDEVMNNGETWFYTQTERVLEKL